MLRAALSSNRTLLDSAPNSRQVASILWRLGKNLFRMNYGIAWRCGGRREGFFKLKFHLFMYSSILAHTSILPFCCARLGLLGSLCPQLYRIRRVAVSDETSSKKQLRELPLFTGEKRPWAECSSDFAMAYAWGAGEQIRKRRVFCKVG